MRTHLLKTLSVCLGLASFGLPDRAAAQLLVGANGLAPQAFTAAPPVAQWSTLSAGANSQSAITTAAQLDGAVQTNTAASVNTALPSNSTIPPALGTTAQWNSTGQYLQSRANGNTYTLLKASLRNTTGSNVSTIVISYDLGALVVAGSSILEEVPGLRAYYSLTGATGTWVHIPELDSATASSSGPQSATLNLGSWPANADLFVLWADDNGSAGSTAPSHEGGYTIDNFSVSFQQPSIFTQPQSQAVSPGLPVTLTVVAGGAAPLTYQWRLNSNNIPNATSSSYSIASAQVSDQGFYQVVINNAFGSIISSNAFLSVSCASPAAITNQPASQTLDSGSILDLRVGATGSTPLTYQWYKNDVAISGATNTVYQRANVTAADSGVYYATVSNCGGTFKSSDAVVAVRSPAFALVGSAQVWRYNQQNVDLGTDWRATNYNDSTWQSGQGILGYPAGENTLGGTIRTVLNANGPAPNDTQIRTYYFRTSFVFTNDPAGLGIFVTNRIDDGVILYLNGQEIRRLGMNAGAVNWQSAAARADEITAHGIEIFELDPFLLLQGTNILAGELHQGGTASSDAIFGVEVWAIPPTPSVLAVTEDPADISVEETKTATFVVGISGDGAKYQWFRESNGIVTAISGANLRTFTIPSTALSDAGNYFVAVSNSINTVYSGLARLTVISDTNPPTLVDADGSANASVVSVSFSEVITAATATNRTNYRITNTVSGAALTITSAVFTNGTNVILGTGPRTAGQNYILVANGIQDLRTNTIATNSSIPIAAEMVTLVGMNSVYRYYDPIPFIGDNANLGTQWKEPGYNDAGPPWGNGSSIFYFGPDDSNVPGSVGSHLDQADAYISYFRSRFNVGFSAGNVKLFLTHVLDDGAVFYLNGGELLRANMPLSGAINYDTPALTAVAPTRSDAIPLPGSLVVTGQNVLAVSLHQVEILDLEKAYGAQLDARVLSYVTGPARITSGVADQTVAENRPVTFEATSVAGGSFQWQQNNANIPGATNSSYTIQQTPLSANGATFRVIVANSSGSVTSSNGTLRVIADTNAPTLLSAVLATSNNTVLVVFSEPVTTASATTLANYRITNSVGQQQSITGATITNGTNVTLTLGAVSGGGLRLIVNGVRDTSAAANAIVNAVAALGVEYFAVSQDGTWKYLLINTNENVQTNYYRTTYDDSSWAGPAPGVLHVEDGALAAGWNKGTQISPTMYELPAPGVSNFYNTIYFRKTVSTPLVGGTVTLRGRVLYDDGVVIYVNGVELVRYNMPAGPITAATAASGHENTDSVPTFEIVVTNWVAGNNVIAAEVHQSAFNSSDVVFGLEMTVSAPSQVIRPRLPVQIVSQPVSRSVGTNANVAFSVDATGDSTITYQWSRNGIDIPGARSTTLLINNVRASDAGSYTVRLANSFSTATSQVATLTVTNGGGSNCTFVPFANTLRLGTNELSQTLVRTNNATTIVLKWTNPVTNSCGSNATVVLQRALSLGNTYPVSSALWTNIYTNVFGSATVSNTVPGDGQAYYRLRVP